MERVVRADDSSAQGMQIEEGVRTLTFKSPGISLLTFSQLQFPSTLGTLDFSGNAWVNDEILVSMDGASLPRLRVVRLSGTAVSAQGVSRFLSKHNGLTELDLREVPMTNASLKSVGQVQFLRILRLGGCHQLTSGGLSVLELPQLEVLDLSGTCITAQQADHMLANVWTRLEELHLRGCERLAFVRIQSWTVFRFGTIRIFEAGARQKPMGRGEIVAMKNAIPVGMSTLRLPPTNEDPKLLVETLTQRPPLNILDLTGWKGLTNEQGMALLNALNPKTMEELCFDGCTRLGEGFFLKLADWIATSRLRRLSLEGTALPGKALPQLATHRFDRLNLARCPQLTARDFEAVQFNAQSLSVEDLPISDAVVLNLTPKGKSSMKELSLRGTHVTMEGLRRLLARCAIDTLRLPSDEVVIEVGAEWTHREFVALTGALHEGVTVLVLRDLTLLSPRSWASLAQHCPPSITKLEVVACNAFGPVQLEELVANTPRLEMAKLADLGSLSYNHAHTRLQGVPVKELQLAMIDKGPEALFNEARHLHKSRTAEGIARAVAIYAQLKGELPEALYWYGMARLRGEGGLPEDRAKAAKEIEEAAKKGSPLANLEIGKWEIEAGHLPSARDYLRTAADRGLPEATIILFRKLWEVGTTPLERTLIEEQDVDRLVKLHHGGNYAATFFNGRRLVEGRHLCGREEQDEEGGRRWIKQAAKHHCREASEWLEAHPKKSRGAKFVTLGRRSGARSRARGGNGRRSNARN